ncbi:hypothetical protein BK133_07090 [Paenibacillus sp. FSL H8-0548]|uniref:hypothetical protein n=1 Tax=Paenibacillus sp. FSL H8-0548 TaxID=1920422 RepID=UPI00096D3042|nr:hypothetical protein [Paenibacillus sp. FSL H8-0548]OMF36975.1 hypothetical protein BK133_07090 [Paenibacillus sp. FSL H8-0548]
MTDTVFAISKQPFVVLPAQTIVQLHKHDTVLYFPLSSGMTASGNAANGVGLSTAFTRNQPNKNSAADNLIVQVYAAMKKA